MAEPLLAPAPCFDLDVLRTLVLAVDLRGFSRAARRVGRSQSAVSLQMRRLEDQAGQRLFEKAGRSFAITPAGERMVGYARRLLALNDEAVATLHQRAHSQPIRLGLLPDFAETWLPATLARFARAHPTVRLEARVDRNLALVADLDHARLDLALVFGVERPRATRLAELPMAWIARPRFAWAPGTSLPLVVFEAPCAFRTAALAALDRAGVAWHVAFTSQSLAGVWAAVDAGIGVTVRTPAGMPRRLRAVGDTAGLPALPRIALWLHEPAQPGAPLIAELRAELEASIARSLKTARPRLPKPPKRPHRRDVGASRRSGVGRGSGGAPRRGAVRDRA